MNGRTDCDHHFIQVTTQQLEKELGERITYAVRFCFNCRRVEFSSEDSNGLYRNLFPDNEDTKDTGDYYHDKIRKLLR